MKTRIMSVVLTVVMLLTLVPVSAFADDPVVAKVGTTEYTNIQDAITAAAPAGTVDIVADITVDNWKMFATTMTHADIITCNIDGLTINGNGHTLTVNKIVSGGNGNYLFYSAPELNINDLTITYADSVSGGINMQSGKLSNVTFNGGTYGVLPGSGSVTIEDCTFKTKSTAIYYEHENDNLVVNGNTFELPETANVILLRGATIFTNNTIISARTVNVVSGSPVVTGNTFAEDVRFKVFNDATATISDNVIGYVELNDAGEVKSTFENNTVLNTDDDTTDHIHNDDGICTICGTFNTTKTITVVNGTASQATADSSGTIYLVADDIIGGKQFMYWEVTTADGRSVIFTGRTSKYASFVMPNCDVTVKAVYRAVLPMFMHSIIVVDSDYGTTSPTGIMLVMQGLSHKFTFTPDEGCEIVDVLINGESVGAVDSYRLTVNEFVNTVEAVYAPIVDAD